VPTNDHVQDYLTAREKLKDQSLPDADRMLLLDAMSAAYLRMAHPQKRRVRELVAADKHQQWLDEYNTSIAEEQAPQK
jgi:hypothetical protein